MNFAKQAACGADQRAVALNNDGADAENQRFNFIFIEHQRRQKKISFVQDEADARCAADVRALLAQRFDVAIDGTQTDTKDTRQFLCGDGLAALSQVLQQGRRRLVRSIISAEKTAQCGRLVIVAERGGFEPPIRY